MLLNEIDEKSAVEELVNEKVNSMQDSKSKT